MDESIVYVRADEQCRIFAVQSSDYLDDVTGWVEIDRGNGEKYNRAQCSYFPKPLYDERLIYRYKLESGVVVERTAEEMDNDWAESETGISDSKRIAALEEQIDMLLSGVTSDE